MAKSYCTCHGCKEREGMHGLDLDAKEMLHSRASLSGSWRLAVPKEFSSNSKPMHLKKRIKDLVPNGALNTHNLPRSRHFNDVKSAVKLAKVQALEKSDQYDQKWGAHELPFEA